jgi:hypothetical protein
MIRDEYKKSQYIANYIKTKFYDTGVLQNYIQTAFFLERVYQEMSNLAYDRKKISISKLEDDDYYSLQITYHKTVDFTICDTDGASITLNLGTGEFYSY